MLRFNKKYFAFTLALFLIEVLIAVYVKDRFIRPYVGDFLVVILIYCALRSFIKAPVLKLAIFVLMFAYCIEVLQYFHIVDLLGLADVRIARIVIGYGFEWLDIVAYTLGVASVILLERIDTIDKNKKSSNHSFF